MTTYATNPQLVNRAIDNLASQCRAFLGQINRMAQSAELLQAVGAGGVRAHIEALDPGETLRNKSGLGGAQTLTREELIEALNDIDAFVTTYATTGKRQLHVKAAGIRNRFDVG